MERDSLKQPLAQNVRSIINSQINQKSLWEELNTLRKKPQIFYSLVSTRKKFYNKKGLLFSPNHPDRSIRTIEGRQPLNELLQVLTNTNPLNPIAFNTDMNNAAGDIAKQYASCHNSNSQFYLNGKELRHILGQSQKYIFPHPIKCLVGLGFRDEYEPLLSLLIDDGIPSRKNRQILLSQEFEVCGVGALPLTDPSLLCAVYLFTKSIIPKSKIPF